MRSYALGGDYTHNPVNECNGDVSPVKEICPRTGSDSFRFADEAVKNRSASYWDYNRCARMTPTTTRPPVHAKGHLLRILGVSFGIAVVVGGAIGSGIGINVVCGGWGCLLGSPCELSKRSSPTVYRSVTNRPQHLPTNPHISQPLASELAQGMSLEMKGKNRPKRSWVWDAPTLSSPLRLPVPPSRLAEKSSLVDDLWVCNFSPGGLP